MGLGMLGAAFGPAPRLQRNNALLTQGRSCARQGVALRRPCGPWMLTSRWTLETFSTPALTEPRLQRLKLCSRLSWASLLPQSTMGTCSGSVDCKRPSSFPSYEESPAAAALSARSIPYRLRAALCCGARHRRGGFLRISGGFEHLLWHHP